MTRKPVDLGRLRLLVHALLGNYQERPGVITQRASADRIRVDIALLDKELADLGYTPARRGAPAALPTDPAARHEAVSRLAERSRLTRLLALPWAEQPTLPGLLDQLVDPDRPTAGAADDAGKVTTGKTGSKPPAPVEGPVDLLRSIVTNVRAHDAAIREELGDTTSQPRSWRRMLWDLPTLVLRLDQPEQHDRVRLLEQHLRSWHSAARVQLGYIAPMVTLTTPCPHCRQVSMIVREDATSDVVCTTPSCIDPKTDSASRWPRQTWKELLAGRYATGVVNTDAAAMHLGIAPATLRDWKRRGLVHPVGGTVRHPLWSLVDLVSPTGRPAAPLVDVKDRCDCGHTGFAHAEGTGPCQRVDCTCNAMTTEGQSAAS